MTLSNGQWLRHHREARRMGLVRLAAILGLDPSYISRIENDHVSVPRVYLQPWAEAIGADADELHYRFGYLPSDLQALLTQNPQLRQDVRELLKG